MIGSEAGEGKTGGAELAAPIGVRVGARDRRGFRRAYFFFAVFFAAAFLVAFFGAAFFAVAFFVVFFVAVFFVAM